MYSPATIHDVRSPCVSAARIVQSACSPTGAPSARYAVLRAKLSDENSCCGVSNEPVVSRLTWPENGVPAKKLVVKRAGELDEAAKEVWPAEAASSAARRRTRIVLGNRRVLQDAAARVAQSPRELAVIVVSGRVAAAVAAGRRRAGALSRTAPRPARQHRV